MGVCALLLGFPCLAFALLGFILSFCSNHHLGSILVFGQGCGYRRGFSPEIPLVLWDWEQQS